MASFPPVKALEPPRLANCPTSSGPKVHVLAAHKANIFDAIPDIRVRHADRHHRLGRANRHHRLGWRYVNLRRSD
jgi:hypothetical protein